MSALVTPDQAAHWYTKTGAPMYTVPKADGKGERNTNLRDARTLGLLPSVTGIIGMLAKPELEAWKQEQAILASLTLPRLMGEPDEQFAKRVVTDAKTQVKDAADLGTLVHAYIEDYLAGKSPEFPQGLKISCEGIRHWIDSNVRDVVFVERPFGSPLGYGGKIDLIAELKNGKWAVVDWKSQFVKAKGPNFYDTWDLQLSGYAMAVEAADGGHGVGWVDERISVVISTNYYNQGVFDQIWIGREPVDMAFLGLLDAWKWKNNYDPAAPAKEIL